MPGLGLGAESLYVYWPLLCSVSLSHFQEIWCELGCLEGGVAVKKRVAEQEVQRTAPGDTGFLGVTRK